MKFGDGNDTARPFAIEDLTQIVEEKKEFSPRFGGDKHEESFKLSPRENPLSSPDDSQREVIPQSSFAAKERESSKRSEDTPERKRRKRMARKASDMNQIIKQAQPCEEKQKATDLHIESSYLKDPDLDEVDRLWSAIIFCCNVYNAYTFFFFLGIQWCPQGLWLIAEVFSELILLVDAIAITYLSIKRPLLLKRLPRLRPIDHPEHRIPKLKLIIRLISAYPQYTINLLARVPKEQLESLPLALLRAIKLLRCDEILNYVNRHLRHVKGSYAVYLKGAQYIFTIVFLIHIMCAVWMLSIRLESPAPWLYEFGFDKASIVEYYSISLFFATSNRGGPAPGDSYPISSLEKLMFCAMVFCGSTTLAALFASLATSIYISNARAIQNNRKLDQIKIYSSTRNLPEELKNKLKSYFALMHLEYTKYEEQYALLQELPNRLKTELMLYINTDFIQKVKLFQLSESSFIVALANVMKPIICLSGDYIVRKGEIANTVYFIKKGLVRVLCADDEKVTLAFMGEGSYFGEIGVLLTGKRSASVAAQTNCVLYYIEKRKFIELLDHYSYHKVFLESVGRQRLQTTYTKDLQVDENSVLNQDRTASNSLILGRSNTSVRFKDRTWDQFTIDQNSRWHVVGSLALAMAIIWNISYTVFAICFEDVMKTETRPFLITIDVIAYLVYVLDLPFKCFIATSSGSTLYGTRGSGERFKLNINLMIDIFTMIPFDFLLWGIGYPNVWIRCISILKSYRIFDIHGVIQAQFKMFHLFNLVLLSLTFFLSSHIIACLLYQVSLYEHNRGGRFDGRTFFTSIQQSYALFEDILKDSIGNRYVHCIYTGICMMGLASFGDVVTTTTLEAFFSSAVTLYSKLFMALFYAEVSNYVSSFYSSYVEHMSKTYQIIEWLKINNVAASLTSRVVNYRNMLWRKFKGIEETSLMECMPETLKYKIKYYILEKLVENADVIPKDDQGAIVTIVKNLGIRVYPKGEFVIFEGEIATEMFFIIEGIIDIYSSKGVKLSRLAEGKCFGEMALLKDDAQIRMASAYCVTDVSIAILKKKEFATICEAYPLFKEKIFGIVREREAQNVVRTRIASQSPVKNPPKQEESRVEKNQSLNPNGIPMNRSITRLASMIEARMVGEEGAQNEDEDARRYRKKLIIASIKFVACFYNFMFIPLQMAFRIKYTPLLYTIESIIMLIYLLEIGYLVIKYRKYGSMVFPDSSEGELENEEQKKINEDTAIKKKGAILRSIIYECLTFLPWSIVLQNVHSPAFVIVSVKMLRLLNFWPIVKFLSLLKTKWLNLFRIIEVLLYYFIFAHIMACIQIVMMYIPPTMNESWVKRLPYPQVDLYGNRQGNNMTGVSKSDIYIAAIYMMYHTLSHVTAGDISAVNINERILTTVYVAFSLHLYVLLFASVTSMVTDLARSLQATLQQKYEDIIATVNVDEVPSELLTKIKDYFDFLWVEYKGMDQDCMEDLPDGIKQDIHLVLYKQALENSFLFKGTHNNFDKRVAKSFMKLAKIKRCMKGDLIVKAGSYSRKTILLLEGELSVVGVPNSRVGIMKPGLFYSGLLLSTNERVKQPHPAHLVATMASTIAVVAEEDMNLLIHAYPVMTNRLQLANEIVDSRCNDTLEDYIHSSEIPKPTQDVLEEEYVYKDKEGYQLVLSEALKPEDPFTVNLNKAVEATHTLILENQGETGSTSFNPQFAKLKRSKARIQDDDIEEHNYFLYPDMKYYYVIYIVHLVNIMYTACIVPLQVGFKTAVGPAAIFFECICILESSIHIVLRLRTVVLLRGQRSSYIFADIFQIYRETGFVYDLFGVLPFNLICLASGIENPLWVFVPLRLLRILIIGNASFIVSYLQLLNHNLSSTIYLLSILSCYFLLWHWISSVWYFVNHTCEENVEITWEKVNELTNASLSDRYVFAMYYTMKLVAGVGSADSYAATNLERIVSCLIVHVGDVLFAVIFGLIAAFASSLSSDVEGYLLQRKKIDEFAESFGISREHKERMEEYLSYVRSLNYNPSMYKLLKNQLPTALAKEIVYEMHRQLLLPVFERFGSLNFLKKLSYYIEIVHYAPGDYIIERGEMGAEMHFIIEGRVAFIAADKHTVIKRVEKGQYFGESALFVKKWREFFVRAETYTCLWVLKRQVFDKLISKFSRLRGKVRRIARDYEKEIGKKIQRESDSEEETKYIIISTLQGLRRHRSETNIRTEIEKYTKKKTVRTARRKAQSRLNVIPAGVNMLPLHKDYTFSSRPRKKLSESEEENPFEPLSEHPLLSSVENKLLTNELLMEEKGEIGKLLVRRKPENPTEKPQRRLSKLTLGKQLAIAPNTGMQFEWTMMRGHEDTIKL